MLSSVLLAGGLRVGSYTSPHLVSFNERICVNGSPVSDQDLLAAFNAIEAARGDISLTYFEVATLAALWIFREHKVDVQVLEVGLGGRLDAVNIIDADLTIITSIGLDHMDWLGDDRGLIAVEKAGWHDPAVPASWRSTIRPLHCAAGLRILVRRYHGFRKTGYWNHRMS